MLEFQDVRIVQGTFTLLADFTVPAGRKVAVIGPSGAGKSTLLAALGGFVPLARGRILCGGEDISETPPGARPLSMLFQDSNLFPHLTVRQNVGLGVNARLRLSADEMSQVDQALARVGLAGFEARRPGALSGGQQSRVALARVLVQRNPVLLLDEPFSALGPALRNGMLDLVSDLLAESKAILLMVTHAPEDVARIADDVIFVEGGRASAPVPSAELMANPPPALRAYLGG